MLPIFGSYGTGYRFNQKLLFQFYNSVYLSRQGQNIGNRYLITRKGVPYGTKYILRYWTPCRDLRVKADVSCYIFHPCLPEINIEYWNLKLNITRKLSVQCRIEYTLAFFPVDHVRRREYWNIPPCTEQIIDTLLTDHYRIMHANVLRQPERQDVNKSYR